MMEAEQIAKGADVLVQILSQAEYDRDEGNIARADFLDVIAARITDLEAQLAARDAEIIQRAADLAYMVCAETRHVTLGDKVRNAILAIERKPHDH